MEPFQMCRFPVPQALMLPPHTIRDAGFELITSWMVPLLFSLEDAESMILTTEQFPTLLQSILNEIWSRKHGTVSV